MSIEHMLNRSLQVWRPTTTPDGYGGQNTAYVQQPDDVAAKVDQPGTDQRMLAQQAGSEHTHDIYLLPGADVRRRDELRDPATGQTWRVLAVVQPSSPVYRKAESELRQEAGV